MSVKVLVVEDEVEVRDSMVAWLEDMGYDVLQARDGIEALALTDSYDPDVILSDLRMPGMGGLELLQHLRETGNRVPFVIISGVGVMKDVVTALQLGASDFITKPISNLELLGHSISRSLEVNRLERDNRIYRQHLERLIEELRNNLTILEEDQLAGSEVQKRLMPVSPMYEGEYCFEYIVSPSLKLSGDFIDYFNLSGGQIGFYIADVSGHGSASAFMTMLLKHMNSRVIRNLGRQKVSVPSPAAFFQSINRAVLETTISKHATLFGGVLDTRNHRLVWSSAAQFPDALLIEQHGIQSLKGDGLPVGLDPGATYQDSSLDFPPGARLVVCSDGVLDVLEAGSLADKEQQLATLLAEKQKLSEIRLGLGLFQDVEFADDIALLSITRQPAVQPVQNT